MNDNVKDTAKIKRNNKLISNKRQNIRVQNDLNKSVKYPISYLETNTIKLTKNPLDDYQRSYFSHVLLNEKDLDLNVQYTTYKTSIAEKLNSPIYQSKQKSNKKNGRYSNYHRRSKHLLECFEYQLPNLRTTSHNFANDEKNQNSNLTQGLIKTYNNNLCLHIVGNQILDGIIIDSREEKKTETETKTDVNVHNYKNENNNNLDPSSNNQPDVSNLINKVPNNLNVSSISYSLTKNQKFKLQKMDHNSETNQKIINPNNCIIWTFEGGYVFLTGIWRLYQDVMKGLINISRKNCDDNETLQKICSEEFDNALSHTIFNSDSNNNTHFYLKRKESQTSKDPNSIDTQISETSKDPPTNTTNSQNTLTNPLSQSKSKYTDLHWNSLPTSLRHELFDEFKTYLIREKNKSPQFIDNIDMTSLIHRIRGGYIKIQGTWIPMEIAKSLCIRFCFPIRFFLVPIFGGDFPDRCEAWFMNNQFKLDLEMFNGNSFQINADQQSNNILNKRAYSDSHLINAFDVNEQLENHDHTSNRQKRGYISKKGNMHHAETHNHISHVFDVEQGTMQRAPSNIHLTKPSPYTNPKDADQGDKPYLPSINTLISSIHNEAANSLQFKRSNSETSIRRIRFDENNIVSGTPLPVNQISTENGICISRPVYQMPPNCYYIQGTPYQQGIQFASQSTYTNDENNQQINVKHIPNTRYYPMNNTAMSDQSRQNIYIPNSVIHVPQHGSLPNNQILYVDNNRQIIHPQMNINTQSPISPNLHNSGQVSTQQVPHIYPNMSNMNQLQMVNHPPQSFVRPQGQLPVQPQMMGHFVSNPIIGVSGGSMPNNPPNQYVSGNSNSENEKFSSQNQRPSNGSQNPN